MSKLASFTRASFKKNEEQQFHCLRDSSGHAGYSLRPKVLGCVWIEEGSGKTLFETESVL